MYDYESGTYWNHVTGEGLHGPLAGYQLETAPLLYMTVEQTLATYPDAQIAISKPPWGFRIANWLLGDWLRMTKRGIMPPYFRETMGEPDTRRVSMDMGLGVWADDVQRYYPLATLKAQGRVIIDELGSRRLLVYVDPLSRAPVALYTTRQSCRWQGNVLRFEDGSRLENGRLLSLNDTPLPLEHPMQMFTRWYGFAYTFPNCEIYSIEASSKPDSR